MPCVFLLRAVAPDYVRESQSNLQYDAERQALCTKTAVVPLRNTPTFFSFLLFAFLPSSRQEDGYRSYDCACSNTERRAELTHR